MLDMFTRGLLERKYAGMEEENRIRQQQANTAGLVGTAQANSLNVNAGLAPRLADSEIDAQGAQTQAIRLGLPFIQKKAQADLDATASGIRVNDSNILRTKAEIGRTNAETGLIGVQRLGLQDMRRRTPFTFDNIYQSYMSRMGGGMP